MFKKPLKTFYKGIDKLNCCFPLKRHKATIQPCFVCFAPTKDASIVRSQRRTRKTLWTTFQSLEKKSLEKFRNEEKRTPHSKALSL
jgi:hypothetical protein